MTIDRLRNFLLKDDGSATPLFIEESQSSPFASPQEKTVLLSSGFSSLVKKGSYHYSASLKLNTDCSDLTDRQLESFARAELDRLNSISFRSFSMDADPRVCIISDSAGPLLEFLDTYGGLLEITPLLIKSAHPDFPLVTDISISNSSDGYELNYTTRSPVNLQRCIYCGACGAVCPESCISEQLFFDYQKCSFCKECEKVCPTQAIDIYAIEEHTLTIPAILLQGEPGVALPAESKAIYPLTRINEFLATLFPAEVEEVVTCERSICQYLGHGKGCTACIETCRFGALSAGEEAIALDSLTCVECGCCVGVCPTGAMQTQKCTDKQFVDFFRGFSLPTGATVFLGSNSELQQFWWKNNSFTIENSLFMEMPQEQTVSLMHILFLIAHGAGSIVILTGTEPVDSQQLAPVNRTIKAANYLLSTLLQAEERVHLIATESFSLESYPGSAQPIFTDLYQDTSFTNRRRKLSSILEFLSRRSDTALKLSADMVPHIATISCDESLCTQCMACLNGCRIEALSAEPETLSLAWTGSMCTGCASCVGLCPESALSMTKELTLTGEVFSPVTLSQAEPMACKNCGKTYGTRKSFEKVMKILSRKNMDQAGHLEYCEDCRVIKLLESQQDT